MLAYLKLYGSISDLLPIQNFSFTRNCDKRTSCGQNHSFGRNLISLNENINLLINLNYSQISYNTIIQFVQPRLN